MRIHQLFLALLLVISPVAAEVQVLADRLHHIRADGPREWSDFPEIPESDRLGIAFDAKVNAAEQTLRLRRSDIKQPWPVTLNGTPIGKLRIDENDMIEYFAIPPGAFVDGQNRLVIGQDRLRKPTPDDIWIGEVWIDPRPVDEALSEARISVRVLDADSGDPIPARITILNADGALQTTSATSNDQLAVRPGLVYTSVGAAEFGVPAGDYEMIAGRGFEYSIDRVKINLKAGERAEKTLKIKRVLDTTGYVACDTHVHTLTHSGHGDATVQERMITLAAEGIELPIATDHNVQIDHEPFAREMGVHRYFTPVIGNEVTTQVGHFNIWPVEPGATPPDWKSTDWAEIFDGIFKTPGVQAVILNHGRDLHGGTIPLGPKLHNAVVGENLEGWVLRANAMETVNSSATQTDIMQLFHDWMSLLNRGFDITPVGSSDSHDVGRHFVGQGRTYIRVDDSDPGKIDAPAAAGAFVAGKVLVSYGLLAELEVGGKKSGELAAVDGDEIAAKVRVSGPKWVSADTLRIFANGELVLEKKLASANWQGTVKLPASKHDWHLVAIATGPGVDGPHWKTAKAYQPDSPDWTAHVLGCSGAVWIDGDGDGKKTAARGYAEELSKKADGDADALLTSLAGYDSAVCAQTANLLYQTGAWPSDQSIEKAGDSVKNGFSSFLTYQRACEEARSQPAP